MNMQTANLAKIMTGYTSGWISVSKDYKKVIASGKSLKMLIQKLNKMGKPEGYLMKAAKDYSSYIGI